MDHEHELLTAEEMADRLRVRPDTIKLWGREGRIPRVEISGRIVRYDAGAVIQFLHDRMRERLDRQSREVSEAVPA